ncbi:MAG: YccF domain-containing protein [Deltaproteobacteria bacterium]|nr:YccF domain-containing protein [Deltaproteobacteria bacterium]
MAHALAPTQPTTLGTLGNVLWIVFGGGLVLAAGYFVAGLLLAITIVGLPFAVQVWKLAWYALLPFDKRVVDATGVASGLLAFVVNVVWFFIAGLWLALAHVGYALACAVTIIGIPFAIAHLKLALLALRPFGKDVV